MELPTALHAPAPARGNSAASVGHLAKAAIAAARDAGVSLPRNAQGLAASQIAKGAEPASVFAAQIAAQVSAQLPADSVPTNADPVDGGTAESTADPVIQAALDGYEAANLISAPRQSDAETALALLQTDAL